MVRLGAYDGAQFQTARAMSTLDLSSQYEAVRGASLVACEPLAIEDYVIQPMADASPPKWHLAHVTWFFEIFLLREHVPGYELFNPGFEYLFNSYYNGVGEQFPRPRRGQLSRPTVAEVMDYRGYVDRAMIKLLEKRVEPAMAFKITLGLHHEQQHQELLFTDLKYNLGNNPLFPAYHQFKRSAARQPEPLSFLPFAGGIHQIGRDSGAEGFGYDNESPRHDVLLRDFELADRLITNGEFLTFMDDGGYRRPELWLSDGWTRVNDAKSGFTAPLYWRQIDGKWHEYGLSGLTPLDLNLPVCHISAYEADAYARWANARLPTEAEWEVAATSVMTSGKEPAGNFVESGQLHPLASEGSGLQQMWGDVWEWTSSSYAPYPGFRPFSGALGEYNGKFMANQLVLRGGSCVTPASHIRSTYRNFFYPGDRWQFSGIRLARD